MGCTDTGLSKSRRIDIGNGRVWARLTSGGMSAWVEMSSDLHQHAVTLDDVLFYDGIRSLTIAEIERAERGLGPDRRCPCGGAGCRGVDDGELHQCGGPREACAVPGCPECRPSEFIVGPVAQAGVYVPPLSPGQVVIIASTKTPAGLTPEQAARYQDETAATLRRLVAHVADEIVDARLEVFTSTVDTMTVAIAQWECASEMHKAMVYAWGAYVARGYRVWIDDIDWVRYQAQSVHRIMSALAEAA